MDCMEKAQWKTDVISNGCISVAGQTETEIWGHSLKCTSDANRWNIDHSSKGFQTFWSQAPLNMIPLQGNTFLKYKQSSVFSHII